MALPISYTIYYYGKNITSDVILADAPMSTIDLPALDSDVKVSVTARNHLASGPSSNIAVGEISKVYYYIFCVYIHAYVCKFIALSILHKYIRMYDLTYECMHI